MGGAGYSADACLRRGGHLSADPADPRPAEIPAQRRGTAGKPCGGGIPGKGAEGTQGALPHDARVCVAESIGVSRQAVSKWETGAADPSTANLLALAKLYGVSPEELLHNAQNGNT